MRRPWILATAGAVLVVSATVLGLFLFRRNGSFELTLPELTIWSIVVGTMTVAFLGLIYVAMRAPTVERRTRFVLFGLFGAVWGLIAGVVFGVFTIHEVDCADVPFCGWSVLGLVLNSSWLSLGLLAAVGVILGTLGGVTAAWLTRVRRTPVTAMRGA